MGWLVRTDKLQDDSIYKEEYEKLLIILKDKDKFIKELKQSKTTEIRTGYYEKKITRHGKKKKQKLKRFEKNPAKLSLGYFGNLEFFCYPYSSFKKIYVRDSNVIHGYDNYDLPRLFAIHNKCRWVTEHGSDAVKGNIDSESSLARMIQNAYNAGLQQELIVDSNARKLELEDKLKSLENMKEKFRDAWLNEEPELKKEWDKRKKSKSGGG